VRAGAAAVVIAVMAACSRRADEPPAPPELPVRRVALIGPGGVRQTYLVEGGDAARAAEVLEARMARMVEGGASRVSVSGERVVVDLPATDNRSLDRLKDVMAAPGSFAVHEVVPSNEAIGSLLDHAVGDEVAVQQRVGVDHEAWTGPDGKPAMEDRFLVAIDRDSLEGYVKAAVAADPALAVAKGVELRYHALPTNPPSWRTYTTAVAPAIDSRAIRRSAVRQMPSGEIVVELALTDEGTKAFAALTRRLVGRKVALVVDGAISSAPIIMSEIPGGKLWISVAGGIGDPRETSEDLAVSLGSGALPGALRLESATVIGN
jgi:preprotein translocase subunit SecD